MILLSNISNLISVKLDNTNYVVWKYQATSILEAYSLLDFIDGSNPCPTKFLRDKAGLLTQQENHEYMKLIACDKTLLSMINAMLSPSKLAIVVGQRSTLCVGYFGEEVHISESLIDFESQHGTPQNNEEQ